MEFNYIVFKRGEDAEIFKVPVSQTARVTNEFALSNEQVDVFKDFNEAKNATLVIIKRYADSRPKQTGMFARKQTAKLAKRLNRFSNLGADDVEQYFF